MSISSGCDACRGDGASSQSCPHCAIPMFPEPHEFQLFGHDDVLLWLLNDTTLEELPPSPPPPPPQPPPPPPDYTESFPEHFLLGEERTFGGPSQASEAIRAEHAATSSDAITSFSEGSRFTDASSENASAPNQGDPSAEREAKVMRYKEKKKKRRYDKHIRYALRQAYAEMRPRINGRFAKAPEMSPKRPPLSPPLPPPYNPS